MLKATNLKTEYLKNPIGIDIRKPKFGWNLEGDSKKQTAYALKAAHSEEELENDNCFWESGKVDSDSITHICYGAAVCSRERIYWKVRIWDEKSTVGDWSETAFFEMGLLEAQDWKAKWVCGDYEPKMGERYPVDEFRKSFKITDFSKARLYITACGLYETKLNGEKVGNQILTPGCTSYDKRVQYQVFDIREQLQCGENVWDISLGDGWFRGKLGVFGATNVFGNRTSVIAQIELTKEDGTIEYIITDDSHSWCNDGSIRFSDMKDGETVDASCKPSYQGKAYITDWKGKLCCSNNVPVREKETFTPVVITTTDGSSVLDFGQNIAGYVEFSIKGSKGHTAKMIMGEMLDEEGNFTLSNLVKVFDFAPEYCDDSRFQTYLYTCGSEMREHWKPKFCAQGFRYVKLENWPEKIMPKNFKAIAVYSEMEETAVFSCSSKDIEQLVKNTLWSMKGNYLDVPTDCPTRERAAWSGDAQLFFDTGCYFMDFTAFFRKWMQDMFDDQAPDGKVYNIVPRVAAHEGMSLNVEGSSGWTDAGVLIPFRYWQHYDDVELLKMWFEPMKKLVDFMAARMGDASDPDLDKKLPPSEYRKYIVTTGFHFGEWNEPNMDGTNLLELPKYEEATAYLIYSLKCFAQIAKIIGKSKDAEKYLAISENAKKAYQYYFTENNCITSSRMCKYVRPLALDLLDDNTKKNVEKELIKMVREDGHHIGTGFLSTPFILKVLSDAGYLEDAYQMLENDDYPSWIYEIRQGATTVWENWNGDASRNHYSNGAACDWIFNTICGISIKAKNRFLIAPKPGGSLTEASLLYRSIYGEVSCSWKKDEQYYIYRIHVPAGCDAEIVLKGMGKMLVTAGDYIYHLNGEKNENETN